MALGTLLASADGLSFTTNYATLPALDPDRIDWAGRRIAILITEADASCQLVFGDSDTEGLPVPSVTSGDEAFSAGIWREAKYPLYVYSTSATSAGVRIYEWVD